ncbi:hypothetical protein PILCRDRAFT_815655 [Piloderma croceum F 1598]|uniref:Uncharacterized protein n=1 Tax=Piloderma croceum (strain F 1598) TaxID=765440 RepID=A0A0C3CBY2_PILCF|nr:hypothetical protein PILCRDRAFT_815655 [Piloderma croceum F 1598]
MSLRPASPGGQAPDVSGSGACQPSLQPGAHLEVTARGSTEDLFSDTEGGSLKGKGVAKRPPIEGFSDSEAEPPQKKRRLMKGMRSSSGRSSDGEKEQPKSKLRRLTKGVVRLNKLSNLRIPRIRQRMPIRVQAAPSP